MSDPSKEPGIENEPHYTGARFKLDPSDPEHPLELQPRPPHDPGRISEEEVEHSVWDEPAAQAGHTPPPGSVTYDQWFLQQRGRLYPLRSIGLTFVICLAAGPLGIIGAFWGAGQTMFSILAIVLFGPMIEEITKIMLPLFIVEKKPYLYFSSIQILVCTVCGGTFFAVIENLVYIHIYIDQPSVEIIVWRWTVCTAMHMVCSCIAGLGLIKIWHQVIHTLKRPKIETAYPYMLTAMCIHGIYNLAVVIGAGP
jgi:hypothetical protein